MSAPLIVGAILVLLAIVIIARTVKVIQQGYVGIVKRVGEFHSIRQPGLTFLVPLVDSMVLVDIRETPRTGDKQDVITRDNVTVSVNATIFSQVVDPKLALFSVSNYFIAIDQLSRTTLRAIFGGMSLDDALSQRERINAQLQAQMESVTDKWGIRINRIEIVDITPLPIRSLFPSCNSTLSRSSPPARTPSWSCRLKPPACSARPRRCAACWTGCRRPGNHRKPRRDRGLDRRSRPGGPPPGPAIAS